jgi:Uma2 family endonuclease
MVVVKTPQDGPAGERRFVLTSVPWWTYIALRDVLDESRVHMTSLKGTLELMSPSELHEEESKLIARLLEAWAEERDVDLRGFKSATFRNEAEERGAEPDECYTVGPKAKDVPPQLAIEVVVSSPLVDKLAVYAKLRVEEVWIWRSTARQLVVHRLIEDHYEIAADSAVLAGLDLNQLTSFIRAGESHTALVRAYRATLRQR